MNCEQVDELLGAYALDALEPNERAAVVAHLRNCQRHPDAAELRHVVERIAETAEPMEPAPALRARVLAAMAKTSREERADDRADGGGRGRPALLQFSHRQVFSVGSLAAVLVVAIIGLAAWNIALQRRSHATLPQLAERVTWVTSVQPTSDGGASGTITYYGDKKMAVVALSGLRALDPARQTYQLWAIAGGTPASVATLDAGPGGVAVVVVPLDAAGISQLAMTIEPAGGSAQPTTTPIAAADV